MTKDELLTLIKRYCEANDIYVNYNDNIFRLVNSLRYNYADLYLLINIKGNYIADIVPAGWYTDYSNYKQISITRLLRSEILKELLN
jgi:hypothetical protein